MARWLSDGIWTKRNVEFKGDNIMMQIGDLLKSQLPDGQSVSVKIGKLREIRKSLWHIRDEMGNRRAKDKLTEILYTIDELLRD